MSVFVRRISLAVAMLPIATAAFAQSAPAARSRSGIFVGYALASPQTGAIASTGDHMNGWVAGVDIVGGSHVGVIGRVDGAYGATFREGVVTGPMGPTFRPSLHTFTAGPRFAAVTRPGVAVFLDALFGVARVGADVHGLDVHAGETASAFVGGGGGGVEVIIRRHLDLGFDVQYRSAKVFGERLGFTQFDAALVLRPWR
jgi:opacity protein-like surface antigen